MTIIHMCNCHVEMTVQYIFIGIGFVNSSISISMFNVIIAVLRYHCWLFTYPFFTFLFIFFLIISFCTLTSSSIIQHKIIYQVMLWERHGYIFFLAFLSNERGENLARRTITCSTNTPYKSKDEPRFNKL